MSYHGKCGARLAEDEARGINEQLQRILSSHLFRSSARCTGLLRHIVERSAAGDAANLKERTIGVELFSRAPDYDTSQDPVVRSAAAELRKKLAQYYEEDEHAAEPRIRIVPGGYVAVFEDHANNGSRSVSPRARPAVLALWTLVAILAVLGGTGLLRRQTPPRSDLDTFWAPVIDARAPVIIFIKDTVAYGSASKEDEDDRLARTAKSSSARERLWPPSNALVAMPGQYVDMGQVASVVQVTSWLTSRSKPYRVVGSSHTTYSSVANAPVLWFTLGDSADVTSTLRDVRFTIQKDGSSKDNVVRDALHPESTLTPPAKGSPRWDTVQDYAVVTLIRTNKDAPLIIASSLTGLGSSGVGEFLTSPESFKRASAALPSDWRTRNTQIVLRIPIMHGATGPTEVVAAHTW